MGKPNASSPKSGRLVGIVGKDGKIADGSVRFIVKADGKVVHDSGILSPKVGTQTIDIPLKGVRMLELSIDPTADGASGDQVTWIAPRIEYQGGMPELVDAHTTDEGPMQSQATIDCLRGKINRLPLWEALPSDKTTFDWLLTPEKSEAGIYRSADGKGIVIANGMVSRSRLHQPDVGRKYAACGQRRGNALD